MKFALCFADSTLSPEAIAATAKKLGYDGVELHFPTKVPTTFEPAALKIACLAGAHASDFCNENSTQSEHIRLLIDLAGRIGCPLVKITESPIVSGQNRVDGGVALGDWLVPVADYAADSGVCIALDNSQSLRTAKELWTILDRLNHPSLGCCLDVLTAARIGESPQVSVPMLNSKIVYVQVGDVKDLANPKVDCDLGDGVVPIKTTIARLRGIGYSSWITVKAPRSPEAVESRLSHAIATLRDWSKGPERAKAKSKALR